jgi:hypothetical protein
LGFLALENWKLRILKIDTEMGNPEYAIETTEYYNIPAFEKVGFFGPGKLETQNSQNRDGIGKPRIRNRDN